MSARQGLGRRWLGQAWIDAVERRARLDPNRLSRGRTYARKGRVYPISIEPGSIRAYVKGSRADPYQVELLVPTFDDDQWGRVFEVLAARADHGAALLDGELDPALVDDLVEVGIELLPRAGEIDPWCSCPDWSEPCKHSAAVCFVAADDFDVDPFNLLRLRGRSRDQALAAIRRLRTAEAASDDDRSVRTREAARSRLRPPADHGVPADEAWARLPGPRPEVPALRAHPARPPAHSVDPPPDATFTASGLRSLAADAADRARSALAEGASLGLAIGFDDDVVRRAVTARHLDDFAAVARRLGTSARALGRRAAAWEVGGHAGLAVLNERKWRADPLVMSAARLRVEKTTRGHVRGEIDGNRLTVGDVQLRLSRTGEWWSFQKRANVWEPLDGPAESAEQLIESRPARRG